jgi:peptidyl-prolyl cis-trans isomerase D
MLKVFRDNLKSLAWILWVVIIVFVLALFLDFGDSFQGGGNKATAATVGSESVTLEEFQRAHRNLESMYRQVYGDQFTPEMQQQMGLPLQALNGAVNQKILKLEARRLGLAVTDAEVRDRILQESVFKDEQGRFVGEERYVEILQRGQLTPAAFESEIREELLLKKLTDALSANLYVSEDEVQRAYRDQVERAKIRYLQLPRARFTAEAQVPPAELATYFAAHKQEFRLPEQREVAYLLVDGALMAEQVKVTEPEMQSWYDAHQAEFTQEEQVQARHILVMINDQRSDEQARQRTEEAKKRLQGGADFAVVAREVSEDPASKDSGGSLGYFGRNRMVKEFEDAAFSAPTGQLVGPVKSSFGYHLIQVLDKRPGGARSFAEVKEQIRGRLAAETARELAEGRAKDLASRLTKDKPRNAEGVRSLAQEPIVTFAETGRFGAQDAVPNLGLNPAFSTAAFALKKGEVSAATQVGRGWAVLYLKEVHPPRVPELAEVEARVRMAATSQKLQQAAMQRLEAARRAGKTLDQAAAELGVGVQETPEFSGQGTIPGIGYNPELAKAVMGLQKGQMGGPIADAQGALLFQVTDHKGWDPKQYAANREQTRATLLQEKVSRLQSALIEQRRRELNVQFDRQLLEQLGLSPEQS